MRGRMSLLYLFPSLKCLVPSSKSGLPQLAGVFWRVLKVPTVPKLLRMKKVEMDRKSPWFHPEKSLRRYQYQCSQCSSEQASKHWVVGGGK